MQPTRRDFLAGASALGVSGPLKLMGVHAETGESFLDIRRDPDVVRVFGPEGEIPLTRQGNAWEGGGTAVELHRDGDATSLRLRSTGEVTRIQLRWRGDMRGVQRYLGDAWERSYADLEWRAEAPNRTMPWYFLAYDGRRTHGYGVRTGPNAFVFWNADGDGISLWADVRSGGGPVRLGPRTLDVATIVCRRGADHESPFEAARSFCRALCPKPRLPTQPVYGTNDWNYAYGNNSAELIERISRTVSDLSPDTSNRPFSVIDDGWSQGGLGHGPWFGNERFGDMGALAGRLKAIGVRPGIWYRPLTALKDAPEAWRLSREKSILDPSAPEALASVGAHVRRLREWGYQLLKHDYTGWDLMGRWGSSMGSTLTADRWSFADRSRTTAEIVLGLYRTIREAAGDMTIIGCNTFSHLSAGLFELYRTGDDTSGRSWDRTRRMGVNTLAFRACQHGAFYSVDPDIVAVTRALPWPLAEQWLRLVSESATSLFVSLEPEAIGSPQTAALRKALALAAKPGREVGVPLDWIETQTPRRWRLQGRETTFSWMPDTGSWPFSD